MNQHVLSVPAANDIDYEGRSQATMIALNTKETYCSQDWLEIHSNRNEMLLDDAQNCLEGQQSISYTDYNA